MADSTRFGREGTAEEVGGSRAEQGTLVRHEEPERSASQRRGRDGLDDLGEFGEVLHRQPFKSLVRSLVNSEAPRARA